jgi:hypothetical protein
MSKGNVVSVTCHEVPTILDICTRHRRVVSLTPWPLYRQEGTLVPTEQESARAGLDVLEEREIYCPCRNSNPRPFSHYSLVTTLTLLSRLLMFVSNFVKMVQLGQRRKGDHRHTQRQHGDLVNLLFAPKRKQKAYKITRCLSVPTLSLETTD